MTVSDNVLIFANVILLVVPVLFAIYILQIERRDNRCEVLDDPTTCNGDGMSWAGSKPTSGDSMETLLEKIKKGSNGETHSIKWRRSFILSVALVYVVVFLNFLFNATSVEDEGYSLPDWRGVYVLISIFFLILYFTYDYYSYHVYSKPRNNIRACVELIKGKLGINGVSSSGASDDAYF